MRLVVIHFEGPRRPSSLSTDCTVGFPNVFGSYVPDCAGVCVCFCVLFDVT